MSELSAAPETSLARLGEPSRRLKRRTGRIRILHVLRAMNRGGIETWLMHTLRHIDRERFEIDFLVGTRERADYDEEIRDFGCRIIPIASQSQASPAGRQRVPSGAPRTGTHDVVHAHEQEMSGYYLRYAAKAAVPLRIAKRQRRNRVPGWAPRSATGCARQSCGDGIVSMPRTGWPAAAWQRTFCLAPAGSRRSWQVFPYGFDLEPFTEPVDRDRVRAIGIKPHDFVIGHVGRL